MTGHPWDKEATKPMGWVHPTLEALVPAFGAQGWRVSSLWRPTGTHSKGISMDVCFPRSYRGGFGPRGARAVWRFVKARFPDQCFLVLAEPDHFHIQLHNKDVLGLQYPGYPHKWFDPITLARMESL